MPTELLERVVGEVAVAVVERDGEGIPGKGEATSVARSTRADPDGRRPRAGDGNGRV